MGTIGSMLSLYWDSGKKMETIGIMLPLYCDNGKENGNCRDYAVALEVRRFRVLSLDHRALCPSHPDSC